MAIALPSGRKIGDGEPCFIICEIGSNWRTLEDCLESIRQAKLAGADAVKFQLFTDEAVYGFRVNHIASMLDKIGEVAPGRLPVDWLPILKAESDRVGIEFMCSAFSPELVKAVDPFVSIHKVASAECNHLRILERLHKIGKPVILSTGAHGVEDIRHAVAALTGFDREPRLPVILLYCVAAYPAQEVELERIPLLSRTFGTLAGYSDHTTDVMVIPKSARLAGATVIEKHVTAIPGVDTPDRGHSLTMAQFRRTVLSIRSAEVDETPGAGDLRPTPAESGMILRHNRRLIATKDIAPGVSLIEGENFGIYRSLKCETHAYHPFMVDEVNGQKARREIKAGDGIGPGDIERS